MTFGSMPNFLDDLVPDEDIHRAPRPGRTRPVPQPGPSVLVEGVRNHLRRVSSRRYQSVRSRRGTW